ncbi:MAG: efflux RND transporter periplasmic adaptor subunit [Bacteroidaceae bacterium]|nr:efflux RND transporter periplasmic adaptor subunit [Bacteroidaceae bacterium]
MNKPTKWGLVGVIVIGLAGWGIWSQIPKENEELQLADQVKKAGSGRKALNVTAEVIKPRSLTDEIVVTGRLIPDEEVNLSFETSGKIISINFTEGSHVTKGELLAKVNDGPLQAQLKKLESQLQLAQDRVYRQNALLEKDAVSKEAYEEARTSLATLQADIDLVKANIAQTELRAPFDGIIGLRQVSEGAFASTGTVVATLTRITPLKIEFAVPERYSSSVKSGMGLTFNIEGQLERLDAKIYATESKVDQLTHTFPVRALYSNTDGKLFPGRFTNIHLKTMEISEAIAIPTEAIVPEMGIDKVFVYKGGKAQPVAITKGIRNEARVQVLDGLQYGDTIITSGTMQLRMGLPVTLDEVK